MKIQLWVALNARYQVGGSSPIGTAIMPCFVNYKLSWLGEIGMEMLLKMSIFVDDNSV